MFMSRTPANVDELPVSELLSLATDSEGMPAAAVRYKIIRMLFGVLGFELSNDTLLMLLSEPAAKLCLSTAGGGKTSSANIQILAEKIMRKSRKHPGSGIAGSKILCLVYNRHNVSDFYEKHKKMVSQLRCANIRGLSIDDELQVTTMHAFCEMWRREYSVECELVGFRLVQEDQALVFMNSASKVVLQKYNMTNNTINANNLYTLYTYKMEAMLSYDEIEETDKFIDLRIPVEALRDIFSSYESIKRRRRVYDFTDMLTKVYALLKSRKDILERVQKFYEYVVVDEVQDFTPLMMELLRLFVNNRTPLLCIGDEDQSIYGFRGADIYNTLDFEDKFPGGEVYLLNRNRRCGKNILDIAARVITRNNMRYQKQLGAVREGGDIYYIPYLTTEGQLLNVIGKIKDFSITQMQKTVICCREKEGSQLLTQLLAENRIPHHVISGYHAYSHELYRHLLDVLYVLYRPLDSQVQLNLYKILPVTKDALFEILQYDDKHGKFLDTKERKHFAQVDYGQFLTHNGFKEVISELTRMSQVIHTEPMCAYVPRLFLLLKKYYWNWKKQYNANPELDDTFEAKVLEYFSANSTFADFLNQHSQNKQFCSTNQNGCRGVAISTFHGLKGLEFDTVFLINLDNDIFPNYPLIDSKNYTDEIKQSLKESEVRLFYVAITRARDTLYMYYQQNNPSLFVKELMGADYQEEYLVYDVDTVADSSGGEYDVNPNPELDIEDDLSAIFEDDSEELLDSELDVASSSEHKDLGSPAFDVDEPPLVMSNNFLTQILNNF